MKTKRLGGTIVATTFIIIFLLLVLKIRTDQQNLSSCEKVCGTEINSCPMAECPFHQNSGNSWFILITIILSSFVGGIGIYLVLSKDEKIIEQKEYDLTKLSEEEKNIFLFIQEHQDGVYQSSLVEKFTISKVQATRILDVLERHNLIERKRRGMTNLLVVK